MATSKEIRDSVAANMDPKRVDGHVDWDHKPKSGQELEARKRWLDHQRYMLKNASTGDPSRPFHSQEKADALEAGSFEARMGEDAKGVFILDENGEKVHGAYYPEKFDSLLKEAEDGAQAAAEGWDDAVDRKTRQLQRPYNQSQGGRYQRAKGQEDHIEKRRMDHALEGAIENVPYKLREMGFGPEDGSYYGDTWISTGPTQSDGSPTPETPAEESPVDVTPESRQPLTISEAVAMRLKEEQERKELKLQLLAERSR